MRLEGRLKAGYFPCPIRPLELLRDRLTYTTQPFRVLDPCIGEGEALEQLMQHGCPYAVELDPERGAAAKLRLPQAVIATPASIFGMDIGYSTFSLVYANPPFDDCMDGGRMETKFLEAVTPLLVDNGVLVMVVPESTTEDRHFRYGWLREFENISQAPFPDEFRKFGEVFVVGTRRKEPNEDVTRYRHNWHPADLWECRYAVPPSSKIPRFKKSGFTDDELLEAFEGSSLNRMLEPKTVQPTPAPPMALGAGHLALMLTAGFLDGIVDTGGDDSHVVRGVSGKEFEQTSSETEETDKGSRTVTILQEKVKLSVRAAFQDGTITTYAMEE